MGVPWQQRWWPELGAVYKPRERWLTVAEYRKLIAALPVERRPHVALCCFLGVRWEELMALSPEDVDGDLVRVRGTKTEGADRLVPANPEAAQYLRELPLPHWTNYLRGLKRACRRAGIGVVTPNDLRRTFCSWMLQAGVDPWTVAKLLGHRDTAMVMRVYGQLGLDEKRAAVARLPRVLRKGGSGG